VDAAATKTEHSKKTGFSAGFFVSEVCAVPDMRRELRPLPTVPLLADKLNGKAIRCYHAAIVGREKNMIEDELHYKVVNASFPNIGKKIALFWGHPEFVALMHELQHDISDRPRAGFPAEVLFALHALESKHDTLFPNLVKVSPDIWVGGHRRL
jgi:hypothetical protein